jgi:uncharacterized phiE125 gp8 family phage protein
VPRNVLSSTAGSGPADPPINVQELCDRLAITDLADQEDIRNLVDEAADEAETCCKSKFVTQTRIQYEKTFGDQITLLWPPLQSVASVTYTDPDGATQTLSSTVYEVSTDKGHGVVRLAYNQSWPAVRDHEDVIAVKYVCGHGTQAQVPQGIKGAIGMAVGHRFEYREGEVPFPQEDFKRRLNPHRYPEIK